MSSIEEILKSVIEDLKRIDEQLYKLRFKIILPVIDLTKEEKAIKAEWELIDRIRQQIRQQEIVLSLLIDLRKQNKNAS